jgi:ribosomal protein L28
LTSNGFYATGINEYAIDLKIKTIHAEVDTVNNLKYNRSKRHKKVNFFVMRVDKNGNVCNSKPCVHCMRTVKQQLKFKGYHCQGIWYTNQLGEYEFSRF